MQNTVAGEHPGADTQPAWFQVDGPTADALQRERNRNRGRGWIIALSAAAAFWVVIGLAIWALSGLLP